MSKWRQGVDPTTGARGRTNLDMTCPQATVDAEAQGWIDLWTSHGAHSRGELPRPWETATFEHSMVRPTANEIRAICKAFPERTGVGVDNWQPAPTVVRLPGGRRAGLLGRLRRMRVAHRQVAAPAALRD
eukprot:610419-Pyramimonas_sp.AAC.1